LESICGSRESDYEAKLINLEKEYTEKRMKLMAVRKDLIKFRETSEIIYRAMDIGYVISDKYNVCEFLTELDLYSNYDLKYISGKTLPNKIAYINYLKLKLNLKLME